MNPDQASHRISRVAIDILMSDSPKKSRIAYHIKKIATQLYISNAASSIMNKIGEYEQRIQEAPLSPAMEEAEEAVSLVKKDLEALSSPEEAYEDPLEKIDTNLNRFQDDFAVLCAALGEMQHENPEMKENLPELIKFCTDITDFIGQKTKEFRMLADRTLEEDKMPLGDVPEPESDSPVDIEFMEQQSVQEPDEDEL
jgi:chromosome segregation ATPase